MKRWLEFPLTTALCALSLPLLCVVWGILRWQMGPPTIFRQNRAGQSGKVFTLVKFRTMTDGRDAMGQLLPDEMRVTRATRLIRRLRLDELPQLWLILGGRLALVGPRPLLPGTIRDFGAQGMLRCSVAPGLTGWAQVSGNTRLSDSEKLALDLWYVAHRNTWLDLRILAETLVVACRGERRRAERLRLAADLMPGAGP